MSVSVSDYISGCSKLAELRLSGNNLSGSVRDALFLDVVGLKTLQWLNLSGNHLNLSQNELRAQLPPEMGLLRNLTLLDLRSAGLYGPLPSDLCATAGRQRQRVKRVLGRDFNILNIFSLAKLFL
jgi:hypothetical protein